jgi:hypothetical protein
MRLLEIAVMLGGKVNSGAYTVGDAIVRVVYKGKSKATQVGGSSPETTAGMLLRELIWDSSHH